MVRQLEQRDREVRAHESAHQAAGGGMVGGATYSYETGPDGKRYAVGGEVPVNLSTSKDPHQTIAAMRRAKAAALAPASPSGQDRAVAAQASAIEAQAQAELLSQQLAQRQDAKQGANARSAYAAGERTAGSATSSDSGIDLRA